MNDVSPAGFKIMRATDAPGLMASACMTIEPMNELQRAGLKSVIAAGYLDGDEIKVLCDIPGFSLTHAWLKRDYPLPLHSHDSDCLYYIVAGSLTIRQADLEQSHLRGRHSAQRVGQGGHRFVGGGGAARLCGSTVAVGVPWLLLADRIAINLRVVYRPVSVKCV